MPVAQCFCRVLLCCLLAAAERSGCSFQTLLGTQQALQTAQLRLCRPGPSSPDVRSNKRPSCKEALQKVAVLSRWWRLLLDTSDRTIAFLLTALCTTAWGALLPSNLPLPSAA